MLLAGPGRQTDESATSLSEKLRDAGGSLEEVPLVGDEIATPFGEAADASDGIAAAGRAQVAAVEDLGAPCPMPGVGHWSVRWVLLHVLEENARHCGHADLLREQLDGATAAQLGS